MSRPSACPGLLRIVAARDGGLCRIKLPGGELGAAQARAIAEASTRHANGVIELTNRANLQLRGVRERHEAALSGELIEAGLGPGAGSLCAFDPAFAPASGSAAGSCSSPLDANDANAPPDTTALGFADDIRNVMTSPTAGRDPSALIDTRPLCAELLALLQDEARFAALSPKFALLLDGGERLARVDHPHDVWLAASADEGGVRFVFGLAGCPGDGADLGADTGTRRDLAGPRPLAAVAPSHALALVRALLHTFLDLADANADTHATRMRDLLATHSADAILEHAQRYVDFPLARDASLAHWQRPLRADAALRLGAHAQRGAHTWHVGGQPPLGRLSAAALQGLGALAQQYGNGTLRITPWQSVLLPDIPTQAVPAVLAQLGALGLACDPAQAITHVIACTGSPGCAKSLADTKADALQLAARLPAGVDVHLSGCPRSCAAAHCTPYTLLAAAPGVYDLYRRDGRSGFGHCVAPPLTIDEAADLLARLVRNKPDA
ncbi:precorrin-3B synthase [Paraburkholderia sp. Cy-641]|uniref:precorrin-3B synthase n=1 Tax=Paraburkholderia sp. Cy-641 TaxID=2608337 RepID=UPI0014244CA6|nr:precorrin-3B synthase [Paraburkholderia sp. Cy-641]